MANNRMYLVCNVCFDLFFIAKTFGYGWYTKDDKLGVALNEWFEIHNHDGKLEDEAGTGDKQFTFITERNDPQHLFNKEFKIQKKKRVKI